MLIETSPLPSRLRRIAIALTLALLALSLLPVWLLPFLPIQDYPQNLFQASLVSDALAGRSTGPFYEVHLHATYSAFFLLVWLFHFLMPLWAAGRAAVSVYFVLTAAAAWKLLRAAAQNHVPAWPALLLFPAAFNAVYFLGFFHFLYALPLLLVALLDLLAAAQDRWTPRRLILQAFWLLLLLYLHAFVLLLYLLIVAAWWIAGRLRFIPRLPLLPPLLLAVAACFIGAAATALGPHAALPHFAFQSPAHSIPFALTLFTGLNGPLHPDALTLLPWLAILALLIACRPSFREPLVRLALVASALLLIAILLFPFRIGSASYLNDRIAAMLYITLILLAACATISPRVLPALLALLLLAGAASFRIQSRISRETAAIAPVVAAMAPDAAILPLLFDPSSPEADPYLFSPHLNDYFYYHLAKAGVSPYLLEGPREQRAPVSLRPALALPAPADLYHPFQFRRELHIAPYRYFLVRGGSPSLHAYMQSFAKPLLASGPWTLYGHSPAAATAARP